MKNLQSQEQLCNIRHQLRDQFYDQLGDETLRRFSDEFFDFLRGQLNEHLWISMGCKIMLGLK